MIRRNPRLLPGVSKSVLREELFSSDRAAAPCVCFGYRQSDIGLEVCPSPNENRAVNLSALNLTGITVHPLFGVAIATFSTGNAVEWSIADNFCQSLEKLPPGEGFTVESRSEEGAPLLITVSGNGARIYDGADGVATVISLPYSLYGETTHCGRLFAADCSDRCKVRWSGLRITDWSDGIEGSGFVLLDGDAGEILTLAHLGDDLLCVRKRGFTVLHAMADSRNFRIAPSQRAVRADKGVNVGATLNGKYYFSSSDGLYSFDGVDLEMVYPAGGKVTSMGRSYVFGDGCVYVECNYGGKDCIMRYRADGGAEFFGADCSHPFYMGDVLYCVKGLEFFALSEGNADKDRLWRKELGGAYGNKTVKNLYVDGDEKAEITVMADGSAHTFCGCGRIPVNVRGVNIAVEIRGDFAVRRIVAELEVKR